jgi:RHH-type proline utilization regulon transcriptional repressor/proline dehydrogenase/delta 1-pyrroline-5-carboxylate dehydrogenase
VRAEPGDNCVVKPRDVLNPADHRDVVGRSRGDGRCAAGEMPRRSGCGSGLPSRPPIAPRCLERAADLMQARIETLLGLIMREAGKSLQNAIAEVREAIDFLRYYAEQARARSAPRTRRSAPSSASARGTSRWRSSPARSRRRWSPAIRSGQARRGNAADRRRRPCASCMRPASRRCAAAPAGRRPCRCGARWRAEHRRDVHRLDRGRPADPGPACRSAVRLDGKPIPLIAETGGQNAMIVDSSALAEQVVGDVIASAFDSAGQRCSALRVLCLQDDVADRVLTMLKGALHELSIGRTDRSRPMSVPSSRERQGHHRSPRRSDARSAARSSRSCCRSDGARHLRAADDHRIRNSSPTSSGSLRPGAACDPLRARDLDRLIDDINATGYGLTFGLHTRLDETIAHVTSR